VHNLRTEMRVATILILTFVYATAPGQHSTEKYQDYFGHTLVLNKYSTFRFDWRFDLILDWASGHWTVSGRTINLKFINVYDTLSRPDKPDSLALSIDEKSSKVSEEEFAQTQLVSGGQHKDRFGDKFYQRGKRFYPTDKNGRQLKVDSEEFGHKRNGFWVTRHGRHIILKNGDANCAQQMLNAIAG
jgi:hypothetical protein